MKIGNRVAAVAVCVMSTALTQCTKSPTAPTPRTTNVTATASVPANPTVPVVVATSDPQSNVSATIPTATAQALVAAAGGAVTITMTDVAPTNYSSLPASVNATLKATDVVLQFSVALTSGAAISSTATAQFSTTIQPTLTDAQKKLAFTGVDVLQPTSGASLLSNSTSIVTVPLQPKAIFLPQNNPLLWNIQSILIFPRLQIFVFGRFTAPS